MALAIVVTADHVEQNLRDNCALALGGIAGAIQSGHDDDLRDRIAWALFLVDRLFPGTVPTIKDQITADYERQLQQVAHSQDPSEAVRLMNELRDLENHVWALGRAAGDLANQIGERN